MNIDFNDKKVLVRVDYNVPLNAQFEITDDTRMTASIPTLRYILDDGGSIILMSHLGRPDKIIKETGVVPREKLTLQHLQKHLSDLLQMPILFCPETVGPKAREMVANLKKGEVLLMENTRFEAGETKGDTVLAKQMADLADCYVNDAFGTAHREHSSTATVARYFPKSKKSFGFLMDAELANAEKILNNPPRPLTAIIGGAKVSDKILLLKKMIHLVDHLIIGGGMAYTFFKAQGGEIGNSLVEVDKLDTALEVMKEAELKGVKIHLPEDSVIAESFSNEVPVKTQKSDEIQAPWMGLDIGPKAVDAFTEVIKQSKAILWNGPMGVFEMSNFANGTRKIALAVADTTQKGAYSLVGGGDSVAAIQQMDLSEQVSYVSTGGGAMLELLEGKILPGVSAMKAEMEA
ncbi:MAG: phosphoglycerate kinase [Saprospiraceae bacterium]